VNGTPVRERDHTEVAVSEHWDSSPEADAIVLLRLGALRVLDNVLAPLFSEVRSLPKDFVFEVLGVLEAQSKPSERQVSNDKKN
jgi:hypothetical protein